MASVAKSFGVVALSTLASRILGLARDLLMAAYFGAGRIADVFFISFMIPNLFRRLVAEGALSVTFVPVYTGALVKKGRGESLALASNVFLLQMLIAAVIVAAGMIFSPEIISVFIGMGSDPGIPGLAVVLTRIMLPYLVFASFVSFAMGYLNSHGRFFAPSFAPVLLNIGMISGIVLGQRYLAQPVYGAAAGVLAGGLLQALLQVPFMVKEGFRLRIRLDFGHPDVVKIFRTMIPAVFGIAVYQVNALAGNLLAGMIAAGSVSYIYYTNRLTELVVGIFIVSVGNVVLPEMSRVRALEEHEKFSLLFSRTVSFALFLAIPAAAGLMVFGLPIVSVIFMRGSFSYADSVMMYKSLFCAAGVIVFIAVQRVVTPVFYTARGTRIPVITAAVSVVLNIVLAYMLMHTCLGHAGIALANTIASAVQAVMLVIFLARTGNISGLGRVAVTMLKLAFSAAVMSVFVYSAAGHVDWQFGSAALRGGSLMLIIAVAALIYFLFCSVLGVEETGYITGRKVRGRD